MNVYEISNLTKIYTNTTRPANDDLNFTVKEGEIFGLLGDNGAGKTTLVGQMVNLLKPTRGTIHLFNQSITQKPLYVSQNVSYMPQSGFALNMLKVSEILYFIAHLRGLSKRDARQERNRIIDRLNLGDVKNKVASRLSGGQQRMVLLATVLTANRPVMILDEPTNDLSPKNRRLVWDLLRAINQKHNTTIILVTHNAIEAERVIERVGIMSNGKLIALGRPGQLKGELNQHLRLEIVFDPQLPPQLPNGSQPHELSTGRWQLIIEREKASLYLDSINQAYGIEDFNLSTATLEDLYLSLAD